MGTIVPHISASFISPHIMLIDLVADSLTTVSSNPANYSRAGNNPNDRFGVIYLNSLG